MSREQGLITTLVSTWRDTLDPKVGALLESYAAAQASTLEELPMKKGERAAVLAQLAKASTDENRTPVLLAFEAFARDASGALVWPAVEAWAEVEPDPRVARMALRTLLALENQLTAKLWRRLVGCVERHGDAGIAREGEDYHRKLQTSTGWGFPEERFANVLRRVSERRGKKQLAPAALEKLEQLARTAKAAPAVDEAAQEAAMIDQILASPQDDGPRAVYADWLLERRHPRGELISLQLSHAKAPQRKREAQLLASHRAAILGPFDGVVTTTGLTFERGLLVEAVTAKALPVTPLTKLLRSVRFLDAVGEGVDLSGLEEATVSPPFVAQLLAHATRLKHLKLQTHWYAGERLAGLRLTPTLESITFDAMKTMLELTRRPEGWHLEVEPHGTWGPTLVALVVGFLDSIEAKPTATIRCTVAQRNFIEPALATRTASVTWARPR